MSHYDLHPLLLLRGTGNVAFRYCWDSAENQSADKHNY